MSNFPLWVGDRYLGICKCTARACVRVCIVMVQHCILDGDSEQCLFLHLPETRSNLWEKKKKTYTPHTLSICLLCPGTWSVRVYADR